MKSTLLTLVLASSALAIWAPTWPDSTPDNQKYALSECVLEPDNACKFDTSKYPRPPNYQGPAIVNVLCDDNAKCTEVGNPCTLYSGAGASYFSNCT